MTWHDQEGEWTQHEADAALHAFVRHLLQEHQLPLTVIVRIFGHLPEMGMAVLGHLRDTEGNAPC
jgi:hypothetical protein